MISDTPLEPLATFRNGLNYLIFLRIRAILDSKSRTRAGVVTWWDHKSDLSL